ncbi:polyphosphate kinase 2 family protein [Actinokineospora sp. NBRC 105648]|uniref:polyphosphate kinase 2 family protein n=1 Tax=Actinokineospora sp. NBRC 105648 TaxID=3032206 RepID=UPI0024A13766|nr:polyphosphate kinase 2 family protein [Actinokineospora sp. NBRC 105648]GLZ38979.1 polyphosphate--nucleotide phosphotransferase [Actinokineospora sp. NBRC 105648]
MAKKKAASVRDSLRVRPGAGIHLSPRDTPVGPASKSDAAESLAETGTRLAAVQEALWAEGVFGGGTRSVLLVLQGMDTSGKGGTIDHVCGLVNPQGLRIASFKKPTRAELRHDFLWRIRKQVPPPGYVGVFDRSHYEDVLVVRVESLVPEEIWSARYDQINDFEAELAAAGTTVVKCFLHISPEEQKSRLVARLEDPQKQWKYNPGDIQARSKWSAYQQAYDAALARCSTEAAPWYVIPADRKWYRNWAVANILLETLTELDPQLPKPDYDVAAELARLNEADPLS